MLPRNHTLVTGSVPLNQRSLVDRLTAYCAAHKLSSGRWLTAHHAVSLRSPFADDSMRGAAASVSMGIQPHFTQNPDRGVNASLNDLGIGLHWPTAAETSWVQPVLDVSDFAVRRSLLPTSRAAASAHHGYIAPTLTIPTTGEQKAATQQIDPLHSERFAEATLVSESRGHMPQVGTAFVTVASVKSAMLAQGKSDADVAAWMSELAASVDPDAKSIRLFNAQEARYPFDLDPTLMHTNAAQDYAPLSDATAGALGSIMRHHNYASTCWIHAADSKASSTHGFFLKPGASSHCVHTERRMVLINLGAFSDADQEHMTRHMHANIRSRTESRFRMFNRWHRNAALPKFTAARGKKGFSHLWISVNDLGFYRNMKPKGIPGVEEEAWRREVTVPWDEHYFNLEQFTPIDSSAPVVPLPAAAWTPAP